MAWLISLVGLVLGQLAPLGAQDGQRFVLVLNVDGIINPPAASYIERGIEQAESLGAEAVVIEMDTPGGLDSSTREIVQAIDNAGVPIILYVTPQGGRAASAGTFIAMASHVIAMAPGTTIGSATPVAIGGEGGAQELPEDLRNKIVNEAVSYIRAHAEERGRNADWAERAVREGANLPEGEALEMNVIEIIARDLEGLLDQADGMEVTLGSGETVTLQTANAAIEREGMNWFESFLHTIANPDIAVILMSVAVLGIIIEISNPGLIFPGTIGVVSLMLGFYGLGTLNASWAGIALLLFGFGLMIAEAFTPTFGLLSTGGVVALLLGAFLLFLEAPPGIEVSPWTLVAVGGIGAATALFFVRAIWNSQRNQAAPLGYGGMVGMTGKARTRLAPEGTIFIRGERWHAHSLDGEIEEGTEVLVERAEGNELWVRPTSEKG